MLKNKNLRKKIILLSLYILTGYIVFLFSTLSPGENSTPTILRYFIIIFSVPLFLKYLIYMTVAPWFEFFNYKNKTTKNNYNPKVSVIVPAWNEEIGIVKTIDSIKASEYKNIETIIINDGSTDKTQNNVLRYIFSQRPAEREKFIYKYQKNSGKAKAINNGIQLANGDIIITIDADSSVKPDTITNIIAEFQDKDVMCVSGNVVVGNTTTIYGIIQYLEYVVGFYLKKADSLMNSIYIVGGAAAAYRKEVFEKLGGFCLETSTEDIEMSMRIQSHGMKINYAPNAIVVTEGANDLNGLMNQRLRWKRGRLEAFYKYKKLFFNTKAHINKVFSFFVLPFALLSDIQLFFELFFISALYYYSIQASDYSALIAGSIIVVTTYIIQIIFETKNKRKLRFALMIPVGWTLSYIITFVEYNALIKSLYGILRKRELVWQRWKREGL